VAVTARSSIAPLQQQEHFTWTFPGEPLRINIPLELVARLQTDIDGHNSRHTSSSCSEIGGALLGRLGVSPDTLDVEDYVLVPSGTADGRFGWSTTAFKQSVSPSDQTRSVGYFRTEWGDTLTLRDEELDAVQKDFPDRTNVVLLIQSTSEDRKAGFLFWDGDEFTPISFMDFPFDAGVLRREARERASDRLEESEKIEIELEPTQEPIQTTGKSPVRLSTTSLWLLCAAMFGLGAGVAFLAFTIYGRLADGLRILPEPPIRYSSTVKAQANGINTQWHPQDRVASKTRGGVEGFPVHWASINTTGPSWISACADGQALPGKMLPAGSELEIEFFRQAQLIVGNAGGVQMELEGKPLGSLGPKGTSRLVQLTPSGFRVLASGSLRQCGKH
jgi:hypothetical protein